MEPPRTKHGKSDSSESDNDSNIRHDRFKSERFQEEISLKSKSKEDYKHVARYNCKRHRDRSPARTLKHGKSKHSSSSYSNQSRSNLERKGFDCQQQYLNPQSSNRNGRSSKDKKYCTTNKHEETGLAENHTKNKLSSILKNFDKHVIESKHNISDNLVIRPVLPPHLIQNLDSNQDLLTEESAIGPILPQHLKSKNEEQNLENTDLPSTQVNKSNNETELKHSTIEGPMLPPHLQNKNHVEETQDNSQTREIHLTHKELPDESLLILDVEALHKTNLYSPKPPSSVVPEVYGPMLPPKAPTDSYGPALPPNLKKETIQGPTIPSDMRSEQLEGIYQGESEDEDTVGPMPQGTRTLTQYQLDLRAMDIKRKLEEGKTESSKEIKKREEWMLELPPEKAVNLGLGPRTFRMKEAPDMSNRSSWTDTPADKLRKEQQALDLLQSGEIQPISSEEMMRTAFIKEREEVMDKMSQMSHEHDRPLSLLELHQKKLKKKKKKNETEGKKKERRPFDRNIDLQVNRFDEAQKKSIFKKAQLLDSRFSSGESKYL